MAMDKKIDDDIFASLVVATRISSEESEAGLPITNTASDKFKDVMKKNLEKAANAAEVIAQKAKINFKALKNTNHKVGKGLSVASAVNWLADVFKDVIERINEHGELLSVIVTQLGKVKDTDDFKEELSRKHDDLVLKFENIEKKCDEMDTVDFKEEQNRKYDDLVQKCDKIADIEDNSKAVEDKLNKKCQELEKNYDEVRQRCLKGNLIISSPSITTSSGHRIPSQAKHEMIWDQYGRYRCESDLEMVLKLVQRKTGFWIEESEVTACHPLGRREKNTFILSVHNRTPMSSWEAITKGMMTAENNFSKDNIFINFQLTKVRGEICKEVRRAKKDNRIKSYEIDVNGRIFIREIGPQNKSVQITCVNDILKYFPD